MQAKLPIKKPCHGINGKTALATGLKLKTALTCTNCNGYHKTIPENSPNIDGLLWFNCTCDSTLTVFVDDLQDLKEK